MKTSIRSVDNFFLNSAGEIQFFKIMSDPTSQRSMKARAVQNGRLWLQTSIFSCCQIIPQK